MPPYKITTRYRTSLSEGVSILLAAGISAYLLISILKSATGTFEFFPEHLVFIISAAFFGIFAYSHFAQALKHIFTSVELTVDDENFTVCIRSLFFTRKDVFPLAELSHLRPDSEKFILKESRFTLFGMSEEESEQRAVLEFKHKGVPQQIGIEWDELDYVELKAAILERRKELEPL